VVPPPARPEGFDFDCAFEAGCIVAETGPWPVLRFLDKAANDRVAVHVAELLNTLLLRPHVEVIRTRPPERPFAAPQGDRQLEPFENLVQAGSCWFV
jgi:hypothetical protein